ncbi:MAG: hypothetical protein CMO80_21225 [Verrucomicrobiales bacterium]|nr:hypothetical protein [Verrucomicrobiales bacterium]
MPNDDEQPPPLPASAQRSIEPISDPDDEPPPLPSQARPPEQELLVAEVAEEPPALPRSNSSYEIEETPASMPAPYIRDEDAPGWDDEPMPSESNTAQDGGGIITRTINWIGSTFEWIFGMATMVVGLAVAAVIPIVNFVSLGYLLEVSGRIARTGKFKEGFIGIRRAARLGSIVAGAWVCFLPVRFVASLWRDAVLLGNGSDIENGFEIGLMLLTVITVWHVVWACLRGGRLRNFIWPAPIKFIRWIFQQDEERFEGIRNTVVNYLHGMRIPYYFWLGARGFAGAFALLFVPVTIMVVGTFLPPGGAALLAFLGGGVLIFVVLYLPFLQTRFACEDRFSAMFEVREVRALFRRAPVAFWLAFFITLLFALLLYLLKIEFPPQDIAWLPTLVFVLFIFPARLLTGWAVSLANRREKDDFFLFKWFSRLLLIPVAGFYAIWVYVAQYFSWQGAFSLYEQHAFLVPYPIFSL